MRARDNPFRTERLLQVRYRLEGTTWDELLRRCESLRYRAALVGPRGSGKTTLLEDLEPRFQARGFTPRRLRLDAEQRAFPARLIQDLLANIAASDLLLLDGAEQMNSLAWHWFRWRTRRAGGLIITTHQPGRLPTLWECRTSPDLLAQIAADLLKAEARTVRERAQLLYEKHAGDLRAALREWYDLAERACPPISA